MKRTRMVVIAVVLLLAIAQSSIVALASGSPDPADMAVYIKNNFTGNSARIEGSIYSAEGNITYNNAGDNFLTGDAYHKTGTSFSAPVGFSGSNNVLNDTEFDEVFPNLADFPVILNTLTFTPAWNAPPVFVTEDAHFNNLVVGQYDGSQGNSPIVVNTTVKDITITVDTLSYQWGYSIKVIGGGKLYLYVNDFTGSAPVIIDNGGNADKTVIVSKKQLKFGEGGAYPQLNAHVYYTGISNLTHQGGLVGSLVSDAATLTIQGGKNIVNGPVYVPSAAVTIQSPGYDDNNVMVPSVEGRVVAKSLTVTGAGYVKYNPNHVDFIVPPEILEPEEPEFPVLPDPDGYKHGILGTYYDSYEPNGPAKKVMKIDSNVAFNWEYDLYPHGTMGRDNFSVVWEGKYRAPATGTYKFKTLSDDGVKLWIGGNKIIENWGLYSFSHTTSGEITLTGGQLYDIRLDYQQGPLYAAVFLFWEYNGTDMGLVPNDHLFVTDSVHDAYSTPVLFNDSVSKSGTGFENKFYSISAQDEDPTGGTPALTETNNIAYNWGWSAPGSITTDMFFGTMEGMLEAKFTEDLTLVFIVDDAIRVWVDNVLVIDEWDYHNGTEFTHQFQVQSGQKYHIKVEYADFYLSGSVYMGWESGSIVREIVPKEYMYLTN